MQTNAALAIRGQPAQGTFQTRKAQNGHTLYVNTDSLAFDQRKDPELWALGYVLRTRCAGDSVLALVTGATGFIGGHLARRLLAGGWAVRVLVRDPRRLNKDLAATCEVCIGDLANDEALERTVREVQVVFHCAANVATFATSDAYLRANVDGVAHLMNALEKTNPKLPRLVHLSTVDVYGYPENPACEEALPTHAGFRYGESKRLGEILLRERCMAVGIAYTILRPTNVIGPGSPYIDRIGKALRSGVMLTVNGGRSNMGFLALDNLLDAMLWAATAPQAIGEVYTVSDGLEVDWQRFLNTLRDAVGGIGLIVNLSFPIAERLAIIFERAYCLAMPGREPPWHRLLLYMFGRTCGHPVCKLRAHGGPVGRIGFEDAMRMALAESKR